ncbi:CDP-glycerol glycerophosphotransferase family protein [Streptomyces sp. A3M-1-3]|uniref:bifunctional glycosyltransferase/CDP-glycerol:glycerophosphate glycerophosphotransferase n=1 Tax=Streptomyces sp. A3M-1-3 TaxID=2962044 RepID=UPI0020B77CA8|nr:bifunctional glycosyltransferase/CDP-glycerol:glycerophosphate glycerophosphotransferase [Streptomyces sp. A3M-1-3]MCP3822168.1 CDP-glycerol glycerophosphotransferase family protein [Streptomyces sp. A3M-1-3]
MTPRLTVVVPIYNVEDYLGECLRSLADQTMPDFEVVMVNDGSTDGSARIAAGFAAGDERFRLVEQANAGLGAARNTGAGLARGEFLAFVDSDDVVPPDAYARMLSALDASGSDFATGNVLRLRASGALEQSPMFRRPMANSRSGTGVMRDWILLGDRIACNKVFRKSFWDAHSFAFPTGVLYEDVAVVLPAHFLAGGVDVLSEPVYHWRDRDGSITNRRSVPRGIRDRVTAVSTVSRFLAERAELGTPVWAEAKRRYDEQALSGDLWLFIEALPEGDADYHQAFLQHANSFADTVDQRVLDGLPLHLRVKWHLIRERRMPELLALLAFEKQDPGTFRVRSRGLRRRLAAEYPVLTGRLPRAVAALKPAELPVTSHLTEAVWRDGKLHLKGYAYVRNVPADTRGGPVRLGWLRAGRRHVIPLRLSRVRTPAATYESRQRLHGYDWAGFETVVDPRRLARRKPRTTWKLEVAVAGTGRLRRGPMRMPGSPAVPAVHYVDDSTRVVPVLSGNKVQLRVEQVHALLTGHTATDGAVRVEGTLLAGSGSAPTTLSIENWYTKAAHEAPLTLSGTAFTADVPLAVFEAGGADRQASVPWGVQLVRADGSRLLVAARDADGPGRYRLGGGRELCVTANAVGNLVLCDQTVQPITDSVSWTQDGHLVLEGTFPGSGSPFPELVLRHSAHHEEAAFPVAHADGRFRAAFPPAAAPALCGTSPLAEGRWYPYFRTPGESDPEQYLPMRLRADQHPAVPVVRTLNGREFTLTRRSHDRLVLESGSALPADARGAHRQQQLRERYAGLRRGGAALRDTVLYCSFDGRQYSDSPRAVHEELAGRGLPLEHLWTVRDQQVSVPPSALPVALHSAEWYEALARSRWIVTNTQLPQWFERAADQFVVQTWHGTPLKRIGRDLAGSACADAEYIATLERRAAQWSVLVSPNRFSTPVMRRAFGYTGDVLECGYPRNDLLHAADRAKVAAAVRERLAIPDGKRVVLYAPTWREDRPRQGGRYRLDPRLDLQLDLAAVERALGADHVLLVRRHYLVGGSVPGSGQGFVRDVSSYPDAAELLLISDVLVTDYSSLMFDFAHTGRPMLFHTYDLAHYRDTLRGFCFDFEARAPGPLFADAAGLTEALRSPVAATADHADAYARFRETFCDLDQGDASVRVANLMLGGGRS